MLQEGGSFVDWLKNSEEIVGEHSLSELRARVCRNAWNSDHECYVHVREGCTSCVSSVRLSEEEWTRRVTERPLSENDQAWIAKYKRTLSEVSQSANHGGSCRVRAQRSASPPARGYSRLRSRMRQRSRSRSRSRSWSRSRSRRRSRSRSRLHNRGLYPEHPGGEWRAVPTYRRQEGSQAIAPYNVAREGSRGWTECSYSYGYGHAYEVGPRGRRYGPRSSRHHPPSQRSAGEAHDDNAPVLVGQDDVDAAVNCARNAQLEAEGADERARRAQGAAAAVRQSNKELLQRLRRLESEVFGGPQTAARPRARADGSDGSMAVARVARGVGLMLLRRDRSWLVLLQPPDVLRRV